MSSTTNGIAEIAGGAAQSLSRLQASTGMPPASTYSIAMTPSADRLSITARP